MIIAVILQLRGEKMDALIKKLLVKFIECGLYYKVLEQIENLKIADDPNSTEILSRIRIDAVQKLLPDIAKRATKMMKIPLNRAEKDTLKEKALMEGRDFQEVEEIFNKLGEEIQKKDLQLRLRALLNKGDFWGAKEIAKKLGKNTSDKQVLRAIKIKLKGGLFSRNALLLVKEISSPDLRIKKGNELLNMFVGTRDRITIDFSVKAADSLPGRHRVAWLEKILHSTVKLYSNNFEMAARVAARLPADNTARKAALRKILKFQIHNLQVEDLKEYTLPALGRDITLAERKQLVENALNTTKGFGDTDLGWIIEGISNKEPVKIVLLQKLFDKYIEVMSKDSDYQYPAEWALRELLRIKKSLSG